MKSEAGIIQQRRFNGDSAPRTSDFRTPTSDFLPASDFSAPAFTLIELLVVIAIVALLIALTMPALGRARDAAKRVECGARMRQFFVASLTYAGEYKDDLPIKNGSGVRYDLVPSGSGVGSILELSRKNYISDIRIFRCPALVGGDPWMANPVGYTGAGYLGYQFYGYSTSLLPNNPSNPFLSPGFTGVHWINTTPLPSDYVMLGDNVCMDDWPGYRNFSADGPNWTGHKRNEQQGGNLTRADGSVRWADFRMSRAADWSTVTDSAGNWYGPFWDCMMPASALIPKDDNDYSVDSNASAARFFWAGASRAAGKSLRGHVQDKAW